MFQLLLIIISYGALLLLLMPPTGAGIISSALLFLLGSGLIILIKPNNVSFEKRKSYFLIPISILIAACLGLEFYNRWLPSSKIQAIASILHMSNETILLMGAFVLGFCSLDIICTIFQILIQNVLKLQIKNSFVRDLSFCLIAAIITITLAQIMIDTEVLSMGYFKFFVGVLIVSLVILLLYCILKKCTSAIFLGAGIFMVISTVNVYVYNFRGRLFEPLDIFSAGTAMNVVGNYNLFPIPAKILIGWGIFIAMLIAFSYLQQSSKSNVSVKRRIVLLAVCSVCSIAIILYASNLILFFNKTI